MRPATLPCLAWDNSNALGADQGKNSLILQVPSKPDRHCGVEQTRWLLRVGQVVSLLRGGVKAHRSSLNAFHLTKKKV